MFLTIMISPMAKPRMTYRSKWVDPKAQQYLAWKEKVGWLLKQQKIKQLTGILKMSCKFYLHIGQYNRVDLSNLIKAIEDACQGFLYENDKQIKELYGKMIPIKKDKQEKIELTLIELK